MFIKKTGQNKSSYLPLKSLWEYSALIRPKILMLLPTFWVPLAVQSASPQLRKVFTVKWAGPWVRAAGETNARHSVSSQLVKYNIIGATIFMTFRTQIHTKQFSKNGYRNLQGTMSHRPYYVSPPIDQYLKFKNHCSLLYVVLICYHFIASQWWF